MDINSGNESNGYQRDVDDRYAPEWISADQEPDELYSEILPGLFQGGTPDEDWDPVWGGVTGGPGDPEEQMPFDAVVSLFAWSRPCDWGVEELRFGFYDAHPRHADMTRVIRAARWAYDRWTAGDRVLIRCQAGLNRSGLVTALVLMLAGWTADDAIRTIRERRAEVALVNRDFVDWLTSDASDALAQDQSSATRSGDAESLVA